MDQQHRKQILRCIDEILPHIDIFALWPLLLEKTIFADEDVNVSGWLACLDHPETVRDIVSSVTTRGPEAYHKLLDCLRQSNHASVADNLEGLGVLPPNNNIPNNIDDSFNEGSNDELWTSAQESEDGYHNKLPTYKEPLRIKVRKSLSFCDGRDYTTVARYPMRSRPRGYVLIITDIPRTNTVKRDAAEHDEANLMQLFQDMGFEVTAKRDLIGADIEQAARDFSERKDWNLVSSCFVIILAHVDESDEKIQGADNDLAGATKVNCDRIINHFASDNCIQLGGKPKVFIFQGCRGKQHQSTADRTQTDGLGERAPRKFSDILVAHSTMPDGDDGYQNEFSGSWYIQILCEVFMKHACHMHLQDLFSMVDSRISRTKIVNPEKLKELKKNQSQTSTTTTIGFHKHCFLNPGLFEES